MSSDSSPIRSGRRRHAPRVEALESRQLLATFDVISAGDSGAGTLRQAILDATAAPGSNVITFHIATGPQSIVLKTALPTLSTTVSVDATTQPGYQGKPLIELNGSQAGDGANGLAITAPGVSVRGLVINRFSGSGIALFNTGGDTVTGNYLGTDATGLFSLGNSQSGITLSNAKNNTIGGTSAGAGNLISDNGLDGVTLYNNSSNNLIEGNTIGLDATGRGTAGNARNGVSVYDSNGNTIGGATAGAQNVISANIFNGIQTAVVSGFPTSADGNVIQANAIGTDATGVAVVGNGGAGIDLRSSFNTIGGATASLGNAIANNRAVGVSIGSGFFPPSSATDNLVFNNSIHDNVQSGIFLGFQANNGQAPPRLTQAYNSTADTTVEGMMHGNANTSYQLQFFSGTTTDLGGSSEGKTVLKTVAVTTDQTGQAAFTVDLGQKLPQAGTFLSATATAPTNNSSGFSNTIPIYARPAADMGVSLFASTPSAYVGQSIIYTATAYNNGPTAATGVTLTDTLPAGVTVVSAQSASGPCTVANGQVVCQVGALASGAQAQVSIIVQASAPGILNDSAAVAADQFDPIAVNNSASTSTQVNTATFDLSVAQSAAPSPGLVLNNETYTITVMNYGPAPAPNTVVTDTLPANVGVVSATSTTGTCAVANGVLTCNLGTLNPYSTATITLVVNPTLAVAPSAVGTITNAVSVAASGAELNPGDNASTLATPIRADLTAPVVTARQLTVTPAGITSIILTFSKPLDPATAQDPKNYALTSAGRDGNFDTRDDVTVALQPIVYNPMLRTVTLTPKSPLKIGTLYRLVVNGTGAPGVTDASGNVLSNNAPYVDYIGRGTRLRPDVNPTLLVLPQFHGGHKVRRPRPAVGAGGSVLGRIVLVPGP